MKKLISLRASIVTIAAASLLAAVPMLAIDDHEGRGYERRGERMQGERGPGGHRGEGRGMKRILSALDLSEEQQMDVQEIMEATRELTAPLREEGRAIHEQIRTLHESDDPNAQELGNLMLEGKALRETLRAEHEAAIEQVRALLTAEQLQKLELLEEMRGQDRKGREGRRRGPRERQL